MHVNDYITATIGAAGLITALVTCTGVAMALMPLTQLRRLLLLRRSDEIAIELFAFATFGSGVWLAYGLARGDLVVVLANAIGIVTNAVVTITALRFRRAPALEALPHD
ncbi:SemiSWEET family transporter [Conexibacter sp. JD483]|uniref:SemiSWEET family transporter n=1 Tax=unclassified Conexibacter TaxID=2627773 RepID=UPI002725DC9D|nr:MULTISPECIES: SemiSWEET family transporter [unclassified Conexibacter]MDO8187345.1 SemiSWEET family transporter [Conexibacter sp. CPCC 205706]MDO8200522.1 SemiSWEET family transporter [Conexibacter sp. CPCC 205762]MDR9370009.1 SemiSWEET family transporter [Conexibacter sp. JD483]